ncbi:hypothetical protein [Bacillus sp. SRB1LM]|nr:hypothetical protein [Bacillus sp. SRB1LM]MBG0962250.1 hypothetical protein [Bacillus sp. SRB1LM]MBG0964115.1 hypothetical protein [Bacillus sp. SRB1LM]MBG0967168.1 hypothetical protein [Bacillus sp. SRB1LM]
MTQAEIKQHVDAIMNEPDKDKQEEMIKRLKESPEYEAVQKFIQSVFNKIKETIEMVMRGIKRFVKIVNVYRSEMRKAFYKKKKTQRKNWKKWKKRKR